MEKFAGLLHVLSLKLIVCYHDEVRSGWRRVQALSRMVVAIVAQVLELLPALGLVAFTKCGLAGNGGACSFARCRGGGVW
eukprot:75609-Amphidinium_carterae.1